MYYQRYMNYQALYEKGVRRITMNSWKLCVNKQTLLPEKKRDFKNFVLIFSPRGKLGTAYFYRYNDQQKISEVKKQQYAYDYKGRLKSVMETDLYTDELRYLAEFEFDEHGRISYERVRYFSRFSEFEKEYHHHYEKNYHSIRYYDKDVGDDLVECLHEEWYNDRGDLTAFKFTSESNGVHMWERYILNERGETELTFSLNEDGKIKDIHTPLHSLHTVQTLEEGKHKRSEHHFFKGELRRIEEYEITYYEIGKVDYRY